MRTCLAKARRKKKTHHVVRELVDALQEEPHPLAHRLGVDGTLRRSDGGAAGALLWVALQKIKRPKQMLRLALLGEQPPLHQHIPHHSHDCKGRAEVLAEAAILPCRRPYLPPHAVHDVPGGTKKHGVMPPVVVACVVALLVAHVVVNDSRVIVDGITHTGTELVLQQEC